MSKWYFRIVCLLFLCISIIPVSGEVDDDGDIQFWLFGSLEKEIKPCSKFSVDGELRYADRGGVLRLAYFQLRYVYQVRKWLEWGPGYRNSWFLNPSERKWGQIYSPFFDLVCKIPIDKWLLEKRTRAQRNFNKYSPNNWELRERWKLAAPCKWGTLRLTPWIYDEVFFREYIGLSQNRLAFGVSFPVGDLEMKTSLYYMVRHLKMGTELWHLQHVYGGMVFYTF